MNVDFTRNDRERIAKAFDIAIETYRWRMEEDDIPEYWEAEISEVVIFAKNLGITYSDTDSTKYLHEYLEPWRWKNEQH